jgi:hypothetical protein
MRKSVPFGALVLHLKQTTPEWRRFQTEMFEPYRRAQENLDHQILMDNEQMKTSSFKD